MKKPSKDIAVNAINSVIRGYTKIDKIRMILAERTHDRKKADAALQQMHSNVLDLQAAMNAQQLIQDRVDAGFYHGRQDEAIADYRVELAFAKIAIRN